MERACNPVCVLMKAGEVSVLSTHASFHFLVNPKVYNGVSSLLNCLLEILQQCGCFVMFPGDPIFVHFLPSTSSSLCLVGGFLFFIIVKKYLLTTTASRQKTVCFTTKKRALFEAPCQLKGAFFPKGPTSVIARKGKDSLYLSLWNSSNNFILSNSSTELLCKETVVTEAFLAAVLFSSYKKQK